MNVLLIVVDSLRADHLGCYGYGKDTSPHLDKLARESALFRQMFAPGIPTTPAFTTLLTGLHPYRHGILSHGGDALLPREIQALPQLAQQAGYTTIGVDNLTVQGNGRGSWFSRGFDYYSAYAYQPFGNQDTQLVDRATRFINDFQQEKFFLFLHLWAPHTPYAPPPPFDTLHYSGPTVPAAKLESIKALAPEYYEAFLGDMKFSKPEDLDWIMAQYDGEISYVDAELGRLFAHVKELGLWDDTAVVVMSDHGECFGEGGFWFDHHGLYDANLRVASIWKVPGQSTLMGQQCDGFVSTEDVLPTLCDLCNWPVPQNPETLHSLTGKSFISLLRGDAPSESELFVGVECSRQASLCVRTPEWKLIVPIARDGAGETVPDFYGNARSDELLLFDLRSDPNETRNVASEYSDVRDDLLGKLNFWRENEKCLNGGHDVILETPLGLPFEEFMGRLGSRKLRS